MEKKIIFVTSLSGKRLNNFMLSSIVASNLNGFEFHLACNTSNADLNDYLKDCHKNNVILHHIDFERNPLHPKNIKAFFQLRNLLKERFDIIHTNTPIGGVLGRLASIGLNSKVIYTAHGFHFHKKSSLLSWLIFFPVEYILSFITDCLITINSEDFEISKKFRAKKVFIIPGVGFNSTFKTSNQRQYNNNNLIRLVSVGELNKNKNHVIVINAISKFSNIEYLIVGEGKYHKKLQRIIDKLNCNDRIKLLGYRSDIKEILNFSDIFILPSKREGLSIALMEAMSMGLPCIVSEIRGNTDLIDVNGGFIFKNKDDLIKKIITLSNSSTFREQFGLYNLDKIKKFSFEIVVNKISDIYTGLL